MVLEARTCEKYPLLSPSHSFLVSFCSPVPSGALEARIAPPLSCARLLGQCRGLQGECPKEHCPKGLQRSVPSPAPLPARGVSSAAAAPGRHPGLPKPRDALPGPARRLSPLLRWGVPDPPRIPAGPRCPPAVTFAAVGRAAPREAAALAAARHGRGAHGAGAARLRRGRADRSRSPRTPGGMATERGLGAERGSGPGTVTPQLRRNRKLGRSQGEVGSYEISLGSCDISKFQELIRREEALVWFGLVFCFVFFRCFDFLIFFPILFISYLFSSFVWRRRVKSSI